MAAATAYKKAQASGQATLRTAILDAASGLLVSEGAAALTMRRVAGAVGASTKVLYTMFGSKEGLVSALCEEGFARLERAIVIAPQSDEPVACLVELGRAYRHYALAEPDYYRVMFGGAVMGYQHNRDDRCSYVTFDFLARAVRPAMDAGLLGAADLQEVAESVWAALHGLVSLELAGHLDPRAGARRMESMLIALGSTLLGQSPSPGS